MIKVSQIEQWELSRIIPYEANAKLHPDEQLEQIAASIAEFGFLDPIAVDESNVILEGHGRLAAATRLKIKTVPVIVIAGLSKAQKSAYRLAHNKLTMNSGFNPEVLRKELEFLDSVEFNIELTGFSLDDLSFDDFPEWEEESSKEEPSGDYTTIKITVSPEEKDLLFDIIGIKKNNSSATEIGSALMSYLNQ